MAGEVGSENQLPVTPITPEKQAQVRHETDIGSGGRAREATKRAIAEKQGALAKAMESGNQTLADRIKGTIERLQRTLGL